MLADWCNAPAVRVCSRVSQNAVACGQQSSSDVASLLVFGIAAEDASRVEAAVARVGSGHRVTLVFWSITAGGG